MSVLYVVATPIGNLEDISSRALRTLKEVDFILCEDTRVTSKLLAHYKIKRPLVSYHQHSSLAKKEQIINLIKEGKHLALVTDAGTPGISDPGNELIARILEELPEQVDIVPIPGPTALAAAASISGMPMNEFLFLGYPPSKNKRAKFFMRVSECNTPVILYESVHRILRSLKDLRDVLEKDRKIMVARELTKKFETVYRGTVEEVAEKLEKDNVKGEFVIIVNKK
ncbi:MAG: 16S rRNA (cytidine(1402)-2'-O)-methyltransferase [Candidatus Spechtbacterales bacterium]